MSHKAICLHEMPKSSMDIIKLGEYDNFQQKLINEIEFTKMSSSISLKEMKSLKTLPLDFIN